MAAQTKNKEAKEKKIVVKKQPIPQLIAGDTVKVHMLIVEGDKERIQMFQGVVIKVSNAADGGNFTVRRVAYGVGVERTFPFASPLVVRVELLRHGRVRRARLFYLRNLSGKAARIKEKRMSKDELAMIEAAGASEMAETPVMETAEAEAAAPETETVAAAPETETKAE